MIYYVYTHTSVETGKVFYVGSAGERIYKNPSKKYKRAHSFDLNRRTKEWAVVAKEQSNIIVSIVCECDSDEQARKKELLLISEYGIDSLVNQRKQAIVWNESKRISSGAKGNAHPMFGKKAKIETKKKKSASLSGENHHLYGKKLPEDWKRNISEAKKGSKNPYYGKPSPPSKKIRNKLTGEIYPSISRAAKDFGITPSSLYQYMDGSRKNKTPFEMVT